ERAVIEYVDGCGDDVDGRRSAGGDFIDVSDDVLAVGEIDGAGSGNVAGCSVVTGVNFQAHRAAAVGGVDGAVEHRAVDKGSGAVDRVERGRGAESSADSQCAGAHDDGRVDGAAEVD